MAPPASVSTRVKDREGVEIGDSEASQMELSLAQPASHNTREEALPGGKSKSFAPTAAISWKFQLGTSVKGVDIRFCGAKCRRAWSSDRETFEVGLEHRLTSRKGSPLRGKRGSNWSVQAGDARKRDSFRCTECGVSEAELGRQLDVHHKIPFWSFKSNVEANKLEHLVSVCSSCHGRLEAQFKEELPLFSGR